MGIFRHCTYFTAICAVFSSCGSVVLADWSRPFLSEGHVTWRPEVSVAADVTRTPQWAVGEDAAAGVPVCVVGERIFSVAMTGEDWTDVREPSCRVECRHRLTGSLLWTTIALDTQESVVEGSRSGIVADAATDVLYYAVGTTLYCFDFEDGAVKWQKSITTAVSELGEGASDVVVNASVSFNGAQVFAVTRDYAGANSAVAAFGAADGEFLWAKLGMGFGTSSAMTGKIAEREVVYVAWCPTAGATGGLRCFDAADGAEVWRSAWATDAPFWGEFVRSPQGKLYGLTYNVYSATADDGDLVCVDAATGELEWKVNALMSDTAPLYADGKIFTLGGPWGGARLSGFSAADGAALFAPINLRETIWRNSMAASADKIFVTYGGTLAAHSMSDGKLISQSAAANFDSAIVLDDDGALFITAQDLLTQQQTLVRFAPTTAVQDWALEQ